MKILNILNSISFIIWVNYGMMVLFSNLEISKAEFFVIWIIICLDIIGNICVKKARQGNDK